MKLQAKHVIAFSLKEPLTCEDVDRLRGLWDQLVSKMSDKPIIFNGVWDTVESFEAEIKRRLEEGRIV